MQCYTGRLLKRGSNDRDCNAVISLAKANDASRIILNVYSGYGGLGERGGFKWCEITSVMIVFQGDIFQNLQLKPSQDVFCGGHGREMSRYSPQDLLEILEHRAG